MFLDPWEVSPEYTFRQGSRRTWVVRARTAPAVSKVQHEEGLAVIQAARPRQSPAARRIERWQPGRAGPISILADQPKTWADIAKGPPTGGSVEKRGFASPCPMSQQRAKQTQQGQIQSVAPSSAELQQAIASALAVAMGPVLAKLDVMEQQMEELRNAEYEGEDMDFEEDPGADTPSATVEESVAVGSDSMAAAEAVGNATVEIKRRRVRLFRSRADPY